jgi:glycosyl transferase family 25
MQIFVINLDRSRRRWERMEQLLSGLAFQRIVAVDGKTLAGPEQNDLSLPRSYGKLSRYNRACTLSHRAAWEQFLAGTYRYGCVLEDDVFLSPDFPQFINDETWIPPDSMVIKLETTRQEVLVSRETLVCRDRTASLLRSLHFGTAAYIVSREEAQALLAATIQPDRTVDCILFGAAGLKNFHPVYQLIPALCIQAGHHENGMIFPEMESLIQPKIQPSVSQSGPEKSSGLFKIKRELIRPFCQLKNLAKSLRWRFQGVRHCRIPFS